MEIGEILRLLEEKEVGDYGYSHRLWSILLPHLNGTIWNVVDSNTVITHVSSLPSGVISLLEDSIAAIDDNRGEMRLLNNDTVRLYYCSHGGENLTSFTAWGLDLRYINE